MSEPDRPAPRDPSELGLEAIVYEKAAPRATFRHGKVFGNPFAEPTYAYYAEFEFEDIEAFKEGTRTPEFNASGEDAQAMGIPFQVHFAEVSA